MVTKIALCRVPNPSICQQWGALQEADTTGGILLGHRYHLLLWQVITSFFNSSLGNYTWELGHFPKQLIWRKHREKGGWAYGCCSEHLFNRLGSPKGQKGLWDPAAGGYTQQKISRAACERLHILFVGKLILVLQQPKCPSCDASLEWPHSCCTMTPSSWKMPTGHSWPWHHVQVVALHQSSWAL